MKAKRISGSDSQSVWKTANRGFRDSFRRLTSIAGVVAGRQSAGKRTTQGADLLTAGETPKAQTLPCLKPGTELTSDFVIRPQGRLVTGSVMTSAPLSDGSGVILLSRTSLRDLSGFTSKVGARPDLVARGRRVVARGRRVTYKFPPNHLVCPSRLDKNFTTERHHERSGFHF